MNLIIGAGSVGTVLAGYLLRAGRPVCLQVRPQRLQDYAAVERLRVLGVDDRALIDEPRPELVQGPDAAVDTLFLAVKRPELPAILDQIAGRVDRRTTLAPCLNGVGLAQTLRERFPDNPIAPVTIMFNARIEDTLVARLTTRPEILIASDDADLLGLFDGSDMTVSRADAATEWGKLLINLNNAVLALTNTGFADLFGDKHLVRAFVRMLDEAVAVLDAAGIEYSLPAPVSYPVYRWLLLHARWLPLLVARRKNGLSDQAYPSMLADLKQGRPTEVDYLNGVIVQLGEAHGMPTPANLQLIKLIKEMETGDRTAYLRPAELNRMLDAL